MDLPKWLIPAGLALGVGFAVFTTRKAGPKVGDVVAVPVAKLLLPQGPPIGPSIAALVPGGMLAGVTLTLAEGDQLQGNVTGYVDPTARTYHSAGLPIGLGPIGFARADAQDIFRGTPPTRV